MNFHNMNKPKIKQRKNENLYYYDHFIYSSYFVDAQLKKLSQIKKKKIRKYTKNKFCLR